MTSEQVFKCSFFLPSFQMNQALLIFCAGPSYMYDFSPDTLAHLPKETPSCFSPPKPGKPPSFAALAAVPPATIPLAKRSLQTRVSRRGIRANSDSHDGYAAEDADDFLNISTLPPSTHPPTAPVDVRAIFSPPPARLKNPTLSCRVTVSQHASLNNQPM